MNDKKRQKEVKERTEKKRVLSRKIKKAHKQMLELDRRERRSDPEVVEAQRQFQYKVAQKRLSPTPNKPCVCGSGKKFKKCCMREIESGQLEITIGKDYQLIVDKPVVQMVRSTATEEKEDPTATTEE